MIERRSLPSAVALEDVLRRGREALAAGHLDGALRTFDAALRIKPTYAPAWRAKGRALRAAGEPKAALDCYAEALRHEPADEASWFGLALTLHALGRRKDEMLAYDEMLRRNPRNAAAWMNRGVALHEAGRYAEALACYDRILAMRPEIAAAWNNRGAALLRLDHPEEALGSFDEALALDPGFADAAANRRTALVRLGRDAPEPVPLTLPPPICLPRSVQSHVLVNVGLSGVDAWRENRPEGADDFLALGTALVDAGTPEAAVAAFKRAEAAGGGAAAALGKLVALDVLRDPRTLSEADRVLTTYATTPRVAIAVARLREQAGDLAGAREALDSILKRQPGLAWLWDWKGLVEFRLGRTTDARASFERATREDPTDAEAWANLAAALHREGRAQEALAACDRALAIDPDCAQAGNNRGVVLAAIGREKEADAVLRRAAKRTGEIAVPLNRARLAESAGRLRAALDLYDTVLTVAPSEKAIAAARRRVIGRLGAKERQSRSRWAARLSAIPGLGPATARRIARAGFDSAAKIRRAREAELRETVKLTAAQARALKRAFRT